MAQPLSTSFYRNALFEFGEFHPPPRGEGAARESVPDRYIVVFPKSSGEIELPDHDPVVGSPNMTVLYNRLVPYRCRMYPGQAERTNAIEMDRQLVVDAISSYDPAAADRGDRVFRIASAPIPSDAYALQLAAERNALGPHPDPLAIETSVLLALDRVLNAAYARRSHAAPPNRLTPQQRDYARWTQSVIAQRFRAELSVQTLSRLIGVSAFHLCRVFKAATGFTLHEYRNGLRLRSAALALAETRTDIARIALDHGFSSQAHFTSAFGRAFGITPGAARAGFRNGADPRVLLSLLPSGSVHASTVAQS